MTRTLNARYRAAVLCSWLAALSYSLPAAAQGLAANPKLADGIKHYDFEFVGWCVLVAIVGGLGRTVLTLLSSEIVVLEVARETWKDLLIAALAGVVGSVVLAAVQSLGVAITAPLEVLILAACGWARMGFFVWAERSARTVAERGAQWAANRISSAAPQPQIDSNAYFPPPQPAARPDSPEQEP
jgi:hypothetical protein